MAVVVNQPIDVAIVGAGPAGCTLAAMLAMRGIRTLVFDDDKRPPLLVGESLLPTVITLLRRLGIEDRAREFSQFKPGVAFIPRQGKRMDFFFPRKECRAFPNYAFNVPRPQFDNLLRERAEELGAIFEKRRAVVEKAEGPREIQLSRETLDATPELAGRHPKLLVDATGRARSFAKTLGIGATRGKRNDVAYFAHYTDFAAPMERDGQVVITTLDRGWSWRIPLPGRMSVGVVLDVAAAKRHGSTPEERLESIIASEPLLAGDGRNRRRLSEVMAYSNYQLISHRGHGPGWVAAGDAFGFVDPMLSPGLMMAMLSAGLLDQHVFAKGRAVLDDPQNLRRGFGRAFRELADWHRSWAEVIDYFYDGRMHSLFEAGAGLPEKYGRLAPPVLMERHLTRRITGMVSGHSTRSRYSRGLLHFAAKYLTRDVTPPEEHAVRAGE